MAKIYNLANEVLASIFKHLKGLDLGTVAKTCQRFRSAAYIDQIWQHLCERGKHLYVCLFYGIKGKWLGLYEATLTVIKGRADLKSKIVTFSGSLMENY